MSLNALSNVNVVSESNVITYLISRNLCFFVLSTLKFSQSFLVFSLTKFSLLFSNFASINSSQVFTLKFTSLPNKKSLN